MRAFFFSHPPFPPLRSDSQIPKLAQAEKLAAAVLLRELEPRFPFLPSFRDNPLLFPPPPLGPDPLPGLFLERFKKERKEERSRALVPPCQPRARFPGGGAGRSVKPVGGSQMPTLQRPPKRDQVINYLERSQALRAQIPCHIFKLT